MSNIVKTGIFVLNVIIAALFLYGAVVTHRSAPTIKNKIMIGAGVYSILYNIYDMYVNTTLLSSVTDAVEDVIEDGVDVAKSVTGGIMSGVSQSVQ